MDQTLHLDFCFSLGADIVLVAGWTPGPAADLVLHAGHVSVPPRHLIRFARRDLRSLTPMGFVAVFDLSTAPGADDPSEDLFLGMGRDYTPVASDRMAQDLRKLIEIGVDEAFFAFLRLVAEARLPMPPIAAQGWMITRIHSAPHLPPEAETHVLSLDRGLVAAEGQGVCSGWFMPATVSAQPLAALILCDRQLATVRMMPGAIARPDLQAYEGRYAYGGRDGWAAAFRLREPPLGRVQILLLLPDRLTASGVIRALDLAPPDRVAGALLQTMQALDDHALSASLHRATLPDGAAPAVALPEGAAPADAGAPLRLILDHDLTDIDLRDVLRHAARVAGRPLHLHLLRPGLTDALNEAVAGAASEAVHPVVLTGCALRPAMAGDDGLAIYARSSALFHLDLALLAGADAGPLLQVAVFDPLAGLPGAGGAGDLARRFLQDRAPFACCGPAPLLLAALARPGSAFLTAEARVRALIETALTKARAHLIAVHNPGFSTGQRGPFCQNLIEGVGWHDFDARSARLIAGAA